MAKRKQVQTASQPGRTEPLPPLDQAWAAYGAEDLAQAQRIVGELLPQAPGDVEAAYLAGLVWRAQGKAQEARLAFQTVVDNHHQIEDHTRGRMLRRLAVGHLNQITRGVWDLEPETWERA
ncbi:MAG: hypothetical protein MUO23_00615 [Anaerolineales bacterium]|nr:hypothetical protein [Anaerolineales bacterium]